MSPTLPPLTITILVDERTGSLLVRLSPCPSDWSKPEAEFWDPWNGANGYVDRLLARYPGSQCVLREGRFDDNWRPILEPVT